MSQSHRQSPTPTAHTHTHTHIHTQKHTHTHTLTYTYTHTHQMTLIPHTPSVCHLISVVVSNTALPPSSSSSCLSFFCDLSLFYSSVSLFHSLLLPPSASCRLSVSTTPT